MSQSARVNDMLGLYLHIPFCQAICSYCNFNRGLVDDALKLRYVDALVDEIARAGDGRDADTIFFGGGTPSLLAPAEVSRVITACRGAYRVAPDAEVTLEANPESISAAALDGWRDAGVNRLSVGVQSFDDAQLRRLGRLHTAARAVDAIRAARTAGFANVSLDLMLWLPGQSPAGWRDTVRQAVEVDPDHISLYLLELYPNAPLKETMARQQPLAAPGNRSWHQASDDDAADMYLEGLAALDAAGYAQYEISNVARPGRASRHNLKYWSGGSWRGFGCGAHSTVEGRRWQNVASTSDYVQRLAEGRPVGLDAHCMTHSEQVQEVLFTGLRLVEGVDAASVEARYGVDPLREYGEELASWTQDGLMWINKRRFGLTRRGMLVSNELLTTFV